MGRKRKFNPTIPAHIDQTAIPTGIYWDSSGNGRWYVVSDGQTRTVATRHAKLSDLHLIAEEREATQPRDSLGRLIQAFEQSLAFAKLSPRTRTDYRAYGAAIAKHRLKTGVLLGNVAPRQITPPAVRRLIDAIGAEHPTKANHWLRYLRRVFAWGIEYGHPGCTSNPCVGVRQVAEKRDHRMPELAIFRTVQAFCYDRGKLPSRARGAVAPYLAPAMEIAYQCRLRGIEVITLTMANIQGDRIVSNRRKGSRDNETLIGPLLEGAIEDLRRYRDTIWTRRSTPHPLRPEDQPLIVTERGDALTRTAWDNSWQRMLKLAISEGVITADQRFGLHGLKHRGVTDTPGDYKAKQHAAGHKSESMVHTYDHDRPVVMPTSDTPASLPKIPRRS